MHGKIADMNTPIASATPKLPVDNKLHYRTMPMKSLFSSTKHRKLGKKTWEGLSTPNVSMISSSPLPPPPHTHQTQAELTI